ncbi:MAG: sodium:solute symporter family protein [candidate division KSB1 bacterium]|nr:sodium:solute symporter family protein [candidate division KSB1 bacterium]MDZ7294017.1 sodium:solute symporter family protein [candidate division KSB1 bacterium]MDZ7385822.1 sodium:solute symporter family protein [candidate division KSB1 bacterium]MDZ7392715.1 sodium:solute symporter family protein [candidate division KSB1 bacterium]MDZ7412077.1 sodium:solute symporter family protein [candidate division KSB1 bacterium]
MVWYLYVILGYLIVLTVLNFYRAGRVKTQEDMMVAGRSLNTTKMVFTLVCTWIGSGTFIAGAEYAYKAGWSSLWLPAGAWVGIAIIYFLAGKIRTFGQYTVGDILEERYGKFARLFGAIALIIAFTTIVSYQFRAGGYILNVVTDGRVSVEVGQALAAGFVILFVGLGGMVAVAHTDLPNGIIIVVACCVATPFTVAAAGGWSSAAQTLPPGHMAVFSPDFGQYPALKAISYCLATMLLLLGVQSMYQKFYSAGSAREARKAVIFWILGTIVVETVVVVIAIYGATYFWGKNIDPASVVLQAARHMVPAPVGLLLLAAACAVVISTGMNYLLSPTTSIMRDIYQRFVNPHAPQARMVALQKTFIVILGLCAFLMIFVPTVLHLPISVLKYSYFAYTMYGVAITPALVAALAWRRANKAGGVASIVAGAVVALALEVVVPYAFPSVLRGGDPWGIPSIYPAFLASLLGLIVGSLLTPPPSEESLAKLFPKQK